MPTIRPATSSDLPGILLCLAKAFEPYQRDYTHDAFMDTVLDGHAIYARMKSMHVLVAVEGIRVLGTVSGSIHGTEGHLRGMAVYPEQKGSGLALQLLTAIESYLASQGCTRVTLDTTLPLKPAIKFYEKNGYTHTGKVTDFFGMPLYEYAKQLQRIQ